MVTPLRKLREARGLTGIEVASAVGLSQSQYSRVEMGAVTTRETAEKLVVYFGRDCIDELQILYPERYTKRHRARA